MAHPSPAAITSFLRFASTSTTATSRQCPRCMRTFSSYRPFRQSSKRQLMTESAYRPQTLDPGPPPPRNSGIPETSIAGSIPTTSEKFSWTQHKRENTAGFVSIPEREAQISKPVAQTATSTTTTPSTRPRSRLRPRKAAMSLTPTAVSRLRELLDDPEPKLIRVGVKNKGCSGSAYHLEYVEKPGKFDEQVEQDGVKVLIDSKALIKIIGSEMDWVEDKLSSRFTFTNPNITEQCGCGESFSVV
ncbi:Fe-S cluster assembly protein SufA [Tothia fuscella]|uniref:Iron-sulfur assembly protein 1 n=1 Tax=Tothia fuscella TaxID=1048955 RepID=A0A9P4TZY7_9PEZI|nr:Fe-S cluster assembly protein SufA [Tothia fuscella]